LTAQGGGYIAGVVGTIVEVQAGVFVGFHAYGEHKKFGFLCVQVSGEGKGEEEKERAFHGSVVVVYSNMQKSGNETELDSCLSG
jgi:hypothetical protein